ncbi:MAG: hypothetical protein RL329_1808 [Bacteroidota bacterium]
MQTPLFDFSNLVFSSVVRALGWMLIDSIWQGFAIALLTAILLKGLQYRSAQTRYQVAYVALMSLFVLAIYNFISAYVVESVSVPAIGIPSKAASIEMNDFVIKVIENQSFATLSRDFINVFLTPYLGVITLAWGIGFCFFGLQLTRCWWQIRRYQQRGGQPLADVWQARLRTFQQLFSNNRSIQLLEVAWTQVPLTVGWLKPIIFVPIGLVNRLQPAEVEAILAHELAHIIQNDYFFNFLQAVVEVIFYYHPAVWWLSSVIRNEREMRCDDMAIAICGNNRLVYAKALVHLQTQHDENQANRKLALHFKKQPSLLFRRIQRIFAPPIQQSAMMEKRMITGLLLCGILIMAVANNRSNNEISSPILNKILNNVVQNKPLSENTAETTDTLPKTTVRQVIETLTVTSDDEIDTIPVLFESKKIATDTVLMPETGKIRIIQSVQSESSNHKHEKEDPDKIIIGSINEFRRNPEGWFTITKYRSKDGGTRIDTIHWSDKKDEVRVDKGKWDAKSVIVTEKDPLLKTLEKELMNDALIMNTRKYEFRLDEKDLNINGDLMEKRVYDKYKQYYKILTTKQLGNGKFALNISKSDTTLTVPPTPNRQNAPTPKMLPGHCYSMCHLDNGSYDEWREIICQDKITPELIKSVIVKLKSDVGLPASVSTTEFTKEARIALCAYQEKYKLPVGNFNIETIKHMGIPIKE